jgi:type III secretion system low calcium response chaperone LcrH/SycD
MATSLSEARSGGARHVLAGGALKDLIGLEPHELEGIYTIAYTELEQGQLDRGERTFRFLCLVDPRSQRHWLGLGTVMQKQQNHAGAVEAFSRAAELGDNPTAALRAAECHLALGLVEEAIAAIEAGLIWADAGGDPDKTIAHAGVLLDAVEQFINKRDHTNGPTGDA